MKRPLPTQPSMVPALTLGVILLGLSASGALFAGEGKTPFRTGAKNKSQHAPQAKIFSNGTDAAAKFGVHEIVLAGDGSVNNPFDTTATVTFTPPSGSKNAKTVHAFYDGDNTWRARVYVSETGAWRWSSVCATDAGMDGKSGAFRAADSKLRGRLLPHSKNSRHWMTEDGQWFLNINDTAYFLLSPYDRDGQPVPSEDVAAYVRDASDRGITSFRSFAFCGPQGFMEDRPERWTDGVFADTRCTRFRLAHFRCADERLRWLCTHHPDAYVQFILFPRGSRWKTDEQFWKNLAPQQKERLLRYMVARYAAYPQIFWLVVNDAHYGKDYPNNNAFAREVGQYFRQHDIWQHPLSTGHARFEDFQFSDEDWATYIHLENAYDLGATQSATYHRYAKPVFLGEDRYEQEGRGFDPADMRYFQRRLYWAWLFSGGSANYGGRWWVVHPYSETGKRPAVAVSPGATVTYSNRLVGLDSVRHIRDYFATRKIELSDFEPAHTLAADLDGRTGTQAPKAMRRRADEYLVYHPNAAADGKEARVDATKSARLRLDLRAVRGRFAVEWYRALDGAAQDGGTVAGGRQREFTSPWAGHDVVLRLTRADHDSQ